MGRSEEMFHEVAVFLAHFDEQRLQGSLSQVPLQGAVAQTLSVEVAGDCAKTGGRQASRLERAGERQATSI